MSDRRVISRPQRHLLCRACLRPVSVADLTQSQLRSASVLLQIGAVKLVTTLNAALLKPTRLGRELSLSDDHPMSAQEWMERLQSERVRLRCDASLGVSPPARQSQRDKRKAGVSER